MPFVKVTFSSHFKRANVYTDRTCMLRCKGCSYKLETSQQRAYLGAEKVKEVLSALNLKRVHFLGGEPALDPDLSEIARFAHEELGAYTKLGHSTACVLPPEHIDAATVSLKAFDDQLHRNYTGFSNRSILENIRLMHKLGIRLDLSSVFIPEYIDLAEIERIARFVASLDPQIPYHIIGYIPVPGTPWRAPRTEEVEEAANLARRFLSNVTFSALSAEQFRTIKERDIRYQSIQVA